MGWGMGFGGWDGGAQPSWRQRVISLVEASGLSLKALLQAGGCATATCREHPHFQMPTGMPQVLAHCALLSDCCRTQSWRPGCGTGPLSRCSCRRRPSCHPRQLPGESEWGVGGGWANDMQPPLPLWCSAAQLGF